MSANNVRRIQFGLGEVICGKGRVAGLPAVTIEPASKPGPVGEKAPLDPELQAGATVLIFHNADGAKVLIDDIAQSLYDGGYDIKEFLHSLANGLRVTRSV